MSLLHRNLVAAAFQEMIKKFEPIAAETAEAVIGIVAPAAAPLIDAGVQVAEAVLGLNAGATTSSTIAAGVAAASAPPAPVSPGALTAAPAPVAPAAPARVNLAAGPNQAALAAVDALAMQLSQLATQLAAIRSNLVPQQ
jgi:hypothetical protein